MEIGLVFPQTEIGQEPETVARFARRAEARGFGHLLAYDHVLGADADREGGWDGPYDHEDAFHEPVALFSYLAALTEELEFVTGVLVLPQRQTALVAKQFAMVDRYAAGRFRLGVGVGWNRLEYVALGQDFGRRGARIEEQVEVLRRLWTENPTSFDGEFHRIPAMGIEPPPVQQPIPIWMGGGADPVLDRIGRTADGWIPVGAPLRDLRDQRDRLHEAARAAGREPESIGVHGRLRPTQADSGELVEGVEAWEAFGADYLSVVTPGGSGAPEDHVEAVDAVADALEDAGLGPAA